MEIVGFLSTAVICSVVGVFIGNQLQCERRVILFLSSCLTLIPVLNVFQLSLQNSEISNTDALMVLKFKNDTKLFNNYMIGSGLLGLCAGLILSDKIKIIINEKNNKD